MRRSSISCDKYNRAGLNAIKHETCSHNPQDIAATVPLACCSAFEIIIITHTYTHTHSLSLRMVHSMNMGIQGMSADPPPQDCKTSWQGLVVAMSTAPQCRVHWVSEPTRQGAAQRSTAGRAQPHNTTPNQPTLRLPARLSSCCPAALQTYRTQSHCWSLCQLKPPPSTCDVPCSLVAG